MYSILRPLTFPRPPESRIAFRRSCFVHFIKKQGNDLWEKEKSMGENRFCLHAPEKIV